MVADCSIEVKTTTTTTTTALIMIMTIFVAPNTKTLRDFTFIKVKSSGL